MFHDASIHYRHDFIIITFITARRCCLVTWFVLVMRSVESGVFYLKEKILSFQCVMIIKTTKKYFTSFPD